MSRFDFFWHAESSHHDPRTRPAKCLSLDLPATTPWDRALELARAQGLPKGSPRCGCFEIQCDLGVYRADDGKRLDRPRAAVRLHTWEELDLEVVS